jgi:hypothetical protein
MAIPVVTLAVVLEEDAVDLTDLLEEAMCIFELSSEQWKTLIIEYSAKW